MPKHTKPNPKHIYGQIRICSSLVTVSNSVNLLIKSPILISLMSFNFDGNFSNEKFG